MINCPPQLGAAQTISVNAPRGSPPAAASSAGSPVRSAAPSAPADAVGKRSASSWRSAETLGRDAAAGADEPGREIEPPRAGTGLTNT